MNFIFLHFKALLLVQDQLTGLKLVVGHQELDLEHVNRAVVMCLAIDKRTLEVVYTYYLLNPKRDQNIFFFSIAMHELNLLIPKHLNRGTHCWANR